MEFRDYAAKETSAVLARLLASRNEATLQQIRALREAFDAAAAAAESAADAVPEVDADLQELVRRLNNAAAIAVRTAAQRVQDDANAALAAVQAELDAQRGRGEELSALLAEAQGHVDSLRGDLRSETQRAAIAERDLAAARARHEELETACRAADASVRQLTDARAALEDELRETRGLLEAALSEAATLQAQLDGERTHRQALVTDLATARDQIAGLETAIQEDARARRSAESDLELVRRSLEEAIEESARFSVQRADLESALAAAEARAHEHTEARAAADHELLHLRRAVDDAIAESARLSVQLEEAAAEKGTLEGEIGTLHAELAELRTTLAGVEAERDVNRASVMALKGSQLDQAATIRDLECRLDAASHLEVSLRAELADHDAASRAEINALHNEVDRLAAMLDGAVLAAGELSAASNITDLLSVLVKQLAGVYTRAALFRLKGNHLEGEHQIGFDLSTDVTKLVIPVSLDSLIARAAASGTVQSLEGSAANDSRLAPFGTSAASALAVPIIVGTDTLAVLYAEEPDQPPAPQGVRSREQQATFATLLVRHAVALLTRLTEEMKAHAELRNYADLLLQEAEQMYVADSEAGKSDEERRRRLRDTIDCARQLFAQRAAMDSPPAASLLDEQIRGFIEGHAGTPFAGDLASATGESEHSRQAAEAS